MAAGKGPSEQRAADPFIVVGVIHSASLCPHSQKLRLWVQEICIAKHLALEGHCWRDQITALNHNGNMALPSMIDVTRPVSSHSL